MQNPNIIKLPNAFKPSSREVFNVSKGETLYEIRNRPEMLDKMPQKDEDISIVVNQDIVPIEEWKTRTLQDNECCLILPKVADDEGGKAVLNVLLMIAVVWSAGALTVNLTHFSVLGVELGVGALNMAIVVTGGLVLSALTPRPQKPSSGFIDGEQSQFFGWSPATVQRQGIVVPRFYGLNKLFGNVVIGYTEKESVTYSQTTVDATYYYLRGVQYEKTPAYVYTTAFDPRKVNLYACFCLGIGPIRQPVVEGTLVLNDQPIENLNSIYYEQRNGLLNQTAMSYFQNTIVEVVVGRVVKSSSAVVYTTKNAMFHNLEVEVSFPKGLFNGIGTDLANYTVNIDIEIKKEIDTVWTLLADGVNITEATGDKVISTYSTDGVFAVEFGYNYDIRVTKNTADQDNIRYGDTLMLDKVREIIEIPFRHNRKALVGVKALATEQLHSSIRFSCWSRGLYVVDYTSSGNEIVYSDNPALIIADILTQPVFSGSYSPWLDMELFLNFEGSDGATSTIDESPQGHSITFGGSAEIDTAQYKFGNSSGYLDNTTGNFLITNNREKFGIWNNLIEDWTFDVYLRMGDHAGSEEIIYGCYVDAENRWKLGHQHGAGLYLIVRVGASNLINVTGMTEITDTNWHHIAIVKKNSGVGIYLDETQVGYALLSNTDGYVFEDLDLYIGQDGNSANYLYGWFDHVRIVKRNIFDANPNSGLTDTITEPALKWTDPGNDFVVERYDGYNSSQISMEDVEDVYDWCLAPQVNSENVNIADISQATRAAVITTTPHKRLVDDVVLFRGVQERATMEIADGAVANVISVSGAYTFTTDLDTSGLTAFASEVKLHLKMEGIDESTTFIDSSPENHTITPNSNVEIDTADFYFGVSSGKFTYATDDYLSAADDSDWDIAASTTTDMTVYGSAKWTSGAYGRIITHDQDGANNYWFVNVTASGRIEFVLRTTGVTRIYLSSATGIVPSNEWFHWALCKVGGSPNAKWALYINGVQVEYVNSSNTGDLTGELHIGSHDGINSFGGWLDEILLIHGNYFSANPQSDNSDTIEVPTASFEPPTVEKMEPRFHFNGGFDVGKDIWEAVLRVCELCRVIPYWEGNTIRFAINKAVPSRVYTFCMCNMLRKTFELSWIPTRERVTEFEVHYRNRKRDFAREPYTLLLPEVGNVTQKSQLDLFGVIEKGVADRVVRHKLGQNRYIKRVAKWSTNQSGLPIVIGDRVGVQHDSINAGEMGSGVDPYTGSGRIISVLASDWIGISSTYYDSHCGDDGSRTIEEALDGSDYWRHVITETHWVILDLGVSYTISKVRGRSNATYDPTDVDIYVSEDGITWGAAVASGITTWRDTSDWVEINVASKRGRYVKIEIVDTENVNDFLNFGAATPSSFAILDIYGRQNDVISIGSEVAFPDADWDGGSTRYTITVQTADDSPPESRYIVGFTVSVVSRATYDITVGGLFVSTPAKDDIWVVGKENLEVLDFSITDIKQDDKQHIHFVGVDYVEALFEDD